MTRPEVQHPVGVPPEEKDAVEKVMGCILGFENSIGRDFHDRCNRFYRQYRMFRKLRDEWTKTGKNDEDVFLDRAKGHWGAHLHIPVSFRTIEEMVPAAIAHKPRLLYFPRNEDSAVNTQSVRLLIDSQQDNIDIDLKFQAVMRAGRIYGVGFGKTYWRTEYAKRRKVQPQTMDPNSYFVGGAQQVKVFDDPYFEDIDVFDMAWDPFGSCFHGSGRTLWAAHRFWLDDKGCLDRLEAGTWKTASAQTLDEKRLAALGSNQKWDESRMERMEASGFGRPSVSYDGARLHEVWEWHDGERVVTVLDREVLVIEGENPCLGSLPFVCYRPTALQGQMVGIGDLEPLEHLQRELDTLRSQRRDATTLALKMGFAYDADAVDEDDLVAGLDMAIPVRNQDPRNAIFPLQRQDPPGFSYEDEKVVKYDIDSISGLSSALDPSSGGTGSGTATEAQLTQAALSRRIALGSRRFEIEVVRNVARAFLHLNQRMIVKARDPLPVPEHGLDEYAAAREGRWQWVPLGPAELQGEWNIIPEGGSMAARNIQQDRMDAVQILQVLGDNPHIDPRKALMKALELFGIRDGESWLKRQPDPVPPAALQMLSQVVDPRLIEFAVSSAQRADPMLNPPGMQQPQGQPQQGAPA